MDKLIDLNTYPVSKNLKALLKDKTTKKNIIFELRYIVPKVLQSRKRSK